MNKILLFIYFLFVSETKFKYCFKCPNFSINKKYAFKKSFKYLRLKYLKYLYYKYFKICEEGYCKITIIDRTFPDHFNIICKGYEKCIIQDIKNNIKDARDLKEFEADIKNEKNR